MPMVCSSIGRLLHSYNRPAGSVKAADHPISNPQVLVNALTGEVDFKCPVISTEIFEEQSLAWLQRAVRPHTHLNGFCVRGSTRISSPRPASSIEIRWAKSRRAPSRFSPRSHWNSWGE